MLFTFLKLNRVMKTMNPLNNKDDPRDQEEDQHEALEVTDKCILIIM